MQRVVASIIALVWFVPASAVALFGEGGRVWATHYGRYLSPFYPFLPLTAGFLAILGCIFGLADLLARLTSMWKTASILLVLWLFTSTFWILLRAGRDGFPIILASPSFWSV